MTTFPKELKDAYEKAAKGVENDNSRYYKNTNNEKKIDSAMELSIFRSEVEKLYTNKKIEEGTYNDIVNEISGKLNNIQELETTAAENVKLNSERKEAQRKFEEYKRREHPVKSMIGRIVGILTLGGSYYVLPTEYNELKTNAGYVRKTDKDDKINELLPSINKLIYAEQETYEGSSYLVDKNTLSAAYNRLLSK